VVEVSSNLVLSFNEVLPLNPEGDLSISRYTSFTLEGTRNNKSPQLTITVTLSGEFGMREEIEDAKGSLSEGTRSANFVWHIVKVFFTNLGVVPDLPLVNSTNVRDVSVESVSLASKVGVPSSFKVSFTVTVYHVEFKGSREVIV